jgi:hypothetical protein
MVAGIPRLSASASRTGIEAGATAVGGAASRPPGTAWVRHGGRGRIFNGVAGMGSPGGGEAAAHAVAAQGAGPAGPPDSPLQRRLPRRASRGRALPRGALLLSFWETPPSRDAISAVKGGLKIEVGISEHLSVSTWGGAIFDRGGAVEPFRFISTPGRRWRRAAVGCSPSKTARPEWMGCPGSTA